MCHTVIYSRAPSPKCKSIHAKQLWVLPSTELLRLTLEMAQTFLFVLCSHCVPLSRLVSDVLFSTPLGQSVNSHRFIHVNELFDCVATSHSHFHMHSVLNRNSVFFFIFFIHLQLTRLYAKQIYSLVSVFRFAVDALIHRCGRERETERKKEEKHRNLAHFISSATFWVCVCDFVCMFVQNFRVYKCTWSVIMNHDSWIHGCVLSFYLLHFPCMTNSLFESKIAIFVNLSYVGWLSTW